MGLKSKLFAVLLGVACTVILGMFLLMQWSFDRGFLRYVHTVEKQRLAALALVLEQRWVEWGDWEVLRGNRMLWRQVLRDSLVADPVVADPELEVPSRNGMPMPRMGEGHFLRRLVLLDEQRRPVHTVTDMDEARDFLPLTLGGDVIGYLGLVPQRHLSSMHQLEFAQEQRRSFFIIALLVAAGAALLALPLAATLLRRVRALTDATHQLAAGNYDVRVNEGARDELGRLAQDFNRLAQTLENNEIARRQWIADISHELRTPLAVLRGEIEAMQDGVRRTDSAAIESLHGEAMRLHRLVDDLYQLSLADLGALSYRKQSLDPVTVLAEAVAEFRPALDRARIRVDNRAHPIVGGMVSADRERLYQLYANLLANVLKYTDPGGRLEIDAACEDGCMILDLQDSAPGVPQEALPRLFDRLYRVEHSRSRATGGAGLGLSICRAIVGAHGGTIEAYPSRLGGVWIRILFPLENKS
ncbi:MAG TPA: HAMP domain-containing protein [Geoalkalibacter subterraneus]|uniref:histidine kinase n=1 Tax=Geoalkalibacter subterraneus TaxID=483547 RepID=A0A831LGV5_9BACT|nr:HAMP domain-containing protein [Geoalkalibacter subterraneus]